ncbi:MAG: MVB12 family protein [Lachnospiraceae bacterium]|nr:MVB12 family protein [Lachnospiraceae bacterium]
MSNIETDNHDVSAIAEALSGLSIDMSSTIGQTADEALILWYRKRFEMLEEDGVPIAINAYLNKLQKDTRANDLTRIHIMKDAMDIIHRCSA